jgi:hypothetical protein
MHMTRGHRLILWLCLDAAIAPLLYLTGRAFALHPLFWDARIYADAITNFNQGKSPYILPHSLPFIYPPVFVLIGGWLARLLPPNLGWKLYLSAHIASVLGLPLVLARFYLRGLGKMEALALFLLAPFMVTEAVFFAGNISSLWYCAALLAAGPGLSANRWKWFYLVTVLASATKITFLLLLLLPLLAGAGQVLGSVITTLVTLGIYLSQKILMPDLYGQFREALSTQTFTARSYGIAPYGVTANLLERFHIMGFAIPAAVQIVFAGAILISLWRLRSRIDPRDERWLALIILALLLINPRMFVYDVTTGLLPVYFLLIAGARLPVTWLLTAISICGFFIGHGYIGFLFLLLSAFVVGMVSLMRTGGEPSSTFANTRMQVRLVKPG